MREGESAGGAVGADKLESEASSKQKGARPNGGRPAQRWQITNTNQEETAELAREARLPEVLAALLIARGIRSAEEAFAFLNPEIAHLHDPMRMKGVEAAVARLERAIAEHEPVSYTHLDVYKRQSL